MFIGALSEIPERVRRLLQASGTVHVDVPDANPVSLSIDVGSVSDPGFTFFAGRRWAYGAGPITGAGNAGIGIACPQGNFGIEVSRIIVSVTAAAPVFARLHGPLDAAGTAINNTGEAYWTERIDGSPCPVQTETQAAAGAGGAVIALGRGLTTSVLDLDNLQWHLIPGARLWLQASITGDLYATFFGRVVLSEST